MYKRQVIVRALNTAPSITKTHIEMNTAIVTSLVRAALAKAFLLGVTPKANVPRYLPFHHIGTNTSVTCPWGVSCCLTRGN